MNSLNIRELCKNYGGFTALKDVSFSIKPGVFGLLGPNGAGKTTMMRIITTILDQSSGSIEYKNLSWNNKNEVRRHIGYLPQKFYFYKNITVMEALRHVAMLKEIKNIKDDMILEVLSKVNLEDMKDKKIKQLSGGMVRRLGIAQAILGDPDILVIDEPTAGLDPEERIRFRNMLCTLDQNKIIIISTHLVEDVEATCSYIGVLDKGKLVFNGTVKEIFEKAEDKVWELSCSSKEFDIIKNKYEISYSVREKDGYRVKILSKESPIEKSIPISPTLEDGYLCLIKSL